MSRVECAQQGMEYFIGVVQLVPFNGPVQMVNCTADGTTGSQTGTIAPTAGKLKKVEFKKKIIILIKQLINIY
jgi:hypothetical protein